MKPRTAFRRGQREAGAPVPHGAIAAMALALADHARGLGLAVVRIQASKCRRSATKNLTLRDARNRLWLIRLSDHQRPTDTGYERPHFDLVTFDGGTGYELAIDYLNRVARGEIVWTEPEPTRKPMRPRIKRRGRR